jgi:hypothetical protein
MQYLKIPNVISLPFDYVNILQSQSHLNSFHPNYISNIQILQLFNHLNFKRTLYPNRLSISTNYENAVCLYNLE